MEQEIKKFIRNIPDFPKPGIQFKDITPVFLNPKLVKEIVAEYVKQYTLQKPDAILGIESRGFLLGPSIATAMDIPFILVRKKGKLPAKTISYTYDLEYGSDTIEVHEGAISKGAKVIVHDDLLATGGTALAAASLVEKAGGEVISFSFLVELAFLKGRTKLVDIAPTHTLVTY